MIRTLLISLLVAAAAGAASDPPVLTFSDPRGDAIPRRTDPGCDGAMNSNQKLPDLVSVSLSKWVSNTPGSDPLNGFVSEMGTHLFKLELVFDGLINPPGSLEDDDGGIARPFRFGPSPLYGFVEINVDRLPSADPPETGRDTGGDANADGRNHYLAHVARFGARPSGWSASRTVLRPGTLDDQFPDDPQFERSSAEFVFELCGCDEIGILHTSVPGDTCFSAGDTWLISGVFLKRASGFRQISRITCPLQEYRARVKVRFSHSTMAEQTTVSMVYALNDEGARQLASLAQPAGLNDRVGFGCDGNEGSILEAIRDIALGVEVAAANSWDTISTSTKVISEGWIDRDTLLAQQRYLDPTKWSCTVLVGTTYSRTIALPPSEDARYIWTDAFPGGPLGDQNGDGVVGVEDRDAICAYIAANDFGPTDADGMMNDSLQTPNFGSDFDVADVNYDGYVDCRDLEFYGGNPCCPADWLGNGKLTVQDVFDFLLDWFAHSADINRSGETSIDDLFEFLRQYFAGCP